MSRVMESGMEDVSGSRSGAPDGRPEGGVLGMTFEIGGGSPDPGP